MFCVASTVKVDCSMDLVHKGQFKENLFFLGYATPSKHYFILREWVLLSRESEDLRWCG